MNIQTNDKLDYLDIDNNIKNSLFVSSKGGKKSRKRKTKNKKNKTIKKNYITFQQKIKLYGLVVCLVKDKL